MSTSYRHQSLSSSDIYIGTLKNMPRKFVSDDPRSRAKLVDLLIFAYREVPRVTTGFYPFELIHGRITRGPVLILKEDLTQRSVSEKRQSVVKHILDLRERLK